MMNPNYYTSHLRSGIETDYEATRERALALTKLDELELWLSRCNPTDEAKRRDQLP